VGRPRADANAVPTKQRILDAAELAFGEHPFAAARLADIAKAAGLRRPSLLYHFPTKDLLHEAVVERLFADLMGRFLEVGQRGGGALVTIDALFQAWVDFIEARPAFAPLVLRGIIDGQEVVRGRMQGQLVPLLDQIEVTIRAAGAEPRSISVRAALLQVGATTLVRAASGPLAGPLWQDEDPMVTVRRLFELPVPGDD
jgi:AcrR family transcriptional regulator